MQETSVPPLVEVDPATNLTDLVVDNARRTPSRAVLARWVDDAWQDVTAEQFLHEVTTLAKGFVAAGVQRGDRVGLMSATRYEWTLTDFALWFAGAVVVPVYETSSAEQVAWILGNSGAVGCVVETPAHTAVVEQVRDRLPALRHSWQLDAGCVEELGSAGAGVGDDELERRRSAAGLSDVATIIYTSGTTARPKGCELTHGNFVVLARNTVARLADVVSQEDSSTLLFLPLAHVFARFIEVLCVTAGARMAHCRDPRTVLTELATFRPTFILAVPRVFEKIYNASEQKAEAAGRGKIFRAAAETSIAYSRALDAGGAGLALRARHALFDHLVYGKLRAALGGRVGHAVSGGAPLGERLGHFYRGIGLVVLEGYGLTETTAPTCVTTPDHMKIGTVGPPLPGTALRIAPDGEVLVRGPHVFAGYWRDERATADVLQDGWLRTGDLGELDDEGYLRITGRKKDIIVTAGGKNVAPAALEDQLRAHPLVSQCVVVGDQRPYIGCLVTLDADMLPTWLANRGRPALTPAEAVDDPEVNAEIARAVEQANATVSRAESIRRFRILPIDFTEDSGHLTPSIKLKRAAVLKDFSVEVEALYS